MIEKIRKEIPSSDGIHTLRGLFYLPENPKGILQISHGMVEHIERYDAFMTYIAENGFIVCGHDHLGHGRTAENDTELGFIAEKDGHLSVCEDVYLFGKAIRAEYPNLKHILLGHSMGSFIVRNTMISHPDACDALILMGTGGPNPLSRFGLLLTSLIGKLFGAKHISRLAYIAAFSSYNKRTASKHPMAWLSRDEEELQKHDADKFCTFRFTVSAMHDLIRLQADANRREWFENLRKDLPILLVSGTEDPVGNYGKGIETIYSRLIEEGITDVTRILYPDMRHEILNEFDREKPYADILSFLNSQIS
ncbi:MAG: lysophospholipase [Clostridia bacterium]|nr:lysophospholipase [Clostridia bacterium]